MQQYLLKKQRRKSLFVLSPAIPMATLFGGSALFYFFFSPSPGAWDARGKAVKALAHTIWRIGTEASFTFACPASFHVWTADEEEWAQRELSFPFSLPSFSPIYKSLIHYKCILYMCAYVKYINIHTLHSTHYPHVCIISVSSKHFKMYLSKHLYMCMKYTHTHTPTQMHSTPLLPNS